MRPAHSKLWRDRVEAHRVAGDPRWGCTGAFQFDHLRVIASEGEDWDHVSVSTETRTPTWDEMEFIRGLFFGDEETVMQLSVPRSEHINNHPHCLHLWRPQKATIPRPPGILVGIPFATA